MSKRTYKSRPAVLPGLSIQDDRIDQAVRECFFENRWKLEQLPATLGGYWHPDDEREVGGLLKHLERVIWFVKKYCETFSVNNGTRDCMLAAAFFHDISDVEIVKFERKARIIDGKMQREIILSRNDEDFDIHPQKSAEMARKYLAKEGVPEEQIKKIENAVASHMSKFYHKMPQPTTMEEKIVSLADYIMSDRRILLKPEERN